MKLITNFHRITHIWVLAAGIFTFLAAGSFLLQPAVYAATCPPGQKPMSDNFIKKKADAPSTKTCCPTGTQNDASKCLFAKYVNPAVRLLSAVAAVATVIGITVGGIQYSTSAGDPQNVAKGKGKVINGLMGFVAFLFLASFIQFMSPGGQGGMPTGSGGTIAERCSYSFLGIKPWFRYLPDSAFDQAGGTCSVDNVELLPTQKGKISHLVPVALAVLDGLLRISGLVAAIFVIVGGVKYITSQGEPSATAQAKDTIINAIIGLVIVMIAATVVNFVGTKLIN